MAKPWRISVVIPTRDTRELTLECLASLWMCGADEVEVIVVDDGGSDTTASAVVRRYPGHTVVRLPQSVGFTRAANHGLKRASGDLLVLLNSDTEVRRNALDVVREAFTREPRLGIGGAVLRNSDGGPQWSGGLRPTAWWCFGLASGIPSLLGRLPFWRRLRPVSGTNGRPVEWVPGTAMVIRREVWDSVGPFDESYRFYCQDVDFCYRAREAGWTVATIPGFKVLHHHGSTIAAHDGAVGPSHPGLMWTDLLALARKHWGPDSAHRAFMAMRWGARLRLAGRGLAEPIIPKENRADWRASNLAYSEALQALDTAYRSRINRIGQP